MTKTTARRAALIAIAAASLLALVGCGTGSKRVEQYKDAGVSSRNDAPAEVGTMPDGFSNWASKCDGPNRVYTVFHYNNDKDTGGDVAGSIAVVANDPRCLSK
jgi:hypothetical protein